MYFIGLTVTSRRSFTATPTYLYTCSETASLIIPIANWTLFRSIKQARRPTSLLELLAMRSARRSVAGVVDPRVRWSAAVYGNRLNYFIELGRTSTSSRPA